MTAWVVRAGGRGEYEELALSEGIAAIGFGLHQSVADFDSRESLRDHMISIGRKLSDADQLWRFSHEISNGDMIVLPRKSPRVVAVGRMAGDYQYRDDLELPHTRRVDWVASEIARTNFGQDLQRSMNADATVFRVRANDAESRIDKIVSQYLQYLAGNVVDDADTTVEASEEDEFRIDLEEQITDRIIDRVRQRFPGTRLEYLVACILRASGYRALETRQGPDGGIDVVAGQGDMGFGRPRLCVQVKSGRSAVDIADYNRLQGNIGSYGADHGLLVGLGDFTRAVRNENERSFFQIRLWGPKEFADKLVETYDALPADIQSEIPIRKRGILIETEG